jgi:hypothetical protein
MEKYSPNCKGLALELPLLEWLEKYSPNCIGLALELPLREWLEKYSSQLYRFSPGAASAGVAGEIHLPN